LPGTAPQEPGHRRPGTGAALASWGIALFEYLLQVPANRIGFQQAGFTVGQLKIVQEVITLGVFVPFAVVYLKEPFKLDYLWAALCMWGRCISSSAVLETAGGTTATVKLHANPVQRPNQNQECSMLFGKLMPRDGNFFEMFNQHADRIVEAARAFSQLVAHYSDTNLREQYNREVDNAERARRPHHA